MTLLGIDFGTATIKAVKVPPDGRPKPHDVVSVSAIASFTDGKIAVGGPVLMMAGVVDDVVVPGLKRMIGRDFDDALVRRACERGGFAARALGDLDLEIHLADEDPKKLGMSLAAACAELLRDACEAATGRRGGHEAVLAVPSWFGARQREALLAIARQAQLRVRRFVRDTVASAYWVAEQRGLSGRLGVIDAGAGGVSASVLRVTGDRVIHEASFGSADAGGDDIDAELARTAFEGSDRTARELVRQACERLKRELGETDEATRRVELPGGRKVDVSLERWEMELLVQPLAKRVAGLVDRLLVETRLDTARLGGVLALGGSSALTAVQSTIRSHLDAPLSGIDGLKSPALGAALRAAADDKKGRARELQDGEDEVPAPIRSAPAASVAQGAAPQPPSASLVRGHVTTRRKEVVRHRPAVTRRRVRPGAEDERPSTAPPDPNEDDADEAATIRADAEEAPPPSERAPATGTPITAPSPGTEPRSEEPGSPPPADEEPHREPPEGTPRGADPFDRSPRSPSDDVAPPSERTPIALGPGSDPVEAPIPPARPTPSGTKYPARDGQRKYPAIDRTERRRPTPAQAELPPRTPPSATSPSSRPSAEPTSSDAPSSAGSTSSGKKDGPRRRPTPVPRSDPATRKRAIAAALRRHTAIGMSAATPEGGGVIRVDTRAGGASAGRRMTIPSASMPRDGTIELPGGAVELMGLAVARPLLPRDLEPIDPIVLLRRLLGRRSVSGSLEIEQGGTVLEVTVQGGRAALDRGEHNALMKALEKGGGRWRLADEVGDVKRRELHPLPRLALDLLRKRLRTFNGDQLEAGLGARVELAPRLRSDKDTLPRKLGLGPRELRFVETMLHGKSSAKSVCRFGGLGASTSYQVLCLLELFECLSWQEPEGPARVGADDAPAAEAASPDEPSQK